MTRCVMSVMDFNVVVAMLLTFVETYIACVTTVNTAGLLYTQLQVLKTIAVLSRKMVIVPVLSVFFLPNLGLLCHKNWPL